jgi:hypothetical protein
MISFFAGVFVGAAVMCVAAKDYKKAVYWIAATVLNACVTF